MRDNNCVICGKDTGRGGMGKSKTKYKGGYVHPLCKQRQDLEKEIIKMKKRQADKSQRHRIHAIKLWRERQK